jgi:hydrogenase maturation factor HypF (carbamoyltransferase family)
MEYFNHANDNFRYNFKGCPNQPTIYSKKFIKLFGSNNEFNKNDITEKQKNIASSAQKIFEEYLENIIKEYSEKTGFKNLVYAGGCALNSLANVSVEEDTTKKVSIYKYPTSISGHFPVNMVLNKMKTNDQYCLNTSLYNNFSGLLKYPGILTLEPLSKL